MKPMEQVNRIYNDPGVSTWLKTMLRSCLGRDIHEAARDATELATVLQLVADEHPNEHGGLVKDEETPCAVVLQFPGRKQ